jgi:ribosomal protein S18 acetylase RimI-like enzyme
MRYRASCMAEAERRGMGAPTVSMRSMRPADAAACAAMVCGSVIGERYGFQPETMAATLRSALGKGGELFVAEYEGKVAGFAWIDPKGAFSSAPYLRLIAVDPSVRGGGIGAALLAEFEARTAGVGRDWCLLVSDFNTAARAFYEKHGYTNVGLLPDFARPGIAEVLMVKKNN